jgi:hypothetical protein
MPACEAAHTLHTMMLSPPTQHRVHSVRSTLILPVPKYKTCVHDELLMWLPSSSTLHAFIRSRAAAESPVFMIKQLQVAGADTSAAHMTPCMALHGMAWHGMPFTTNTM